MKQLGVSLRSKFHKSEFLRVFRIGRTFYKELAPDEILQEGDCIWFYTSWYHEPIKTEKIGGLAKGVWGGKYIRPIYKEETPAPWHIRLYKLFFTSEI